MWGISNSLAGGISKSLTGASQMDMASRWGGGGFKPAGRHATNQTFKTTNPIFFNLYQLFRWYSFAMLLFEMYL